MLTIEQKETDREGPDRMAFYLWKALCPIDTKRWILSDGITTLPYFHWRIQAYKNIVKAGISEKQAEKRAITAKLPEKYQNECTSHIASS